MESTQSLTKQFLIQLTVNIIAGAIVTYIMIKLLQPKDDGTTTALAKPQGTTTTPTVTATATPTTV